MASDPRREVVKMSAATRASDASSEDDGSRLALELLRELGEQEFRRTDRMTSRSRQAVALAAGFFAVAQTVAFSDATANAATQLQKTQLVWLAGIAAVTLTVGAVLLIFSEKARGTAHLSPAMILDEVNAGVDRSGLEPVDRLAVWYATFVEGLRAENNGRAKWTNAAQMLSGLSIAVVLLELIFGLSVRI